MKLSAFDFAGLLTHAVVLGIGLGGIARQVTLPRGRRSGVGLVLMAAAMALLFTRPTASVTRFAVGLAHVVIFGIALWLLVGPVAPNGSSART